MPQILMDSFSGYLLTYVNTAQKHDANYDIAVQMLRHYDRLPALTLDQMAALCYVSQASISRFCKAMGFATFGEFREALRSAFNVERCYPRNLSHFLQNPADPDGEYMRSLRSNQEQVVSRQNLDVMDKLLPELHQARRVACFGSHFNWDCATFFQKRMILLGKYIEAPYHGEDQLNTAHSLGHEDLAIIISAGCNYRSRYGNVWELLMGSSVKVALVTQTIHSIFANDADFVLSSGVSNQFDNGKLSTLQLIDLIVMKYIDRYGHEAADPTVGP